MEEMVNGAGFISGSIAQSGASGGGSTVGAETSVDNELAKVREFLSSNLDTTLVSTSINPDIPPSPQQH